MKCEETPAEEVIRCWCGASGAYDELFADDFPDGCNGTGYVVCQCGDNHECACHHHGEPTECVGCGLCDRRFECGDDYFERGEGEDADAT